MRQLCDCGSLIISGFAISARNRHTDIDFKQTQGMSLWSYSLHGRDRYVLEKRAEKGEWEWRSVTPVCLSVSPSVHLLFKLHMQRASPCVLHWIYLCLTRSFSFLLDLVSRNCAPLSSLCLLVPLFYLFYYKCWTAVVTSVGNNVDGS